MVLTARSGLATGGRDVGALHWETSVRFTGAVRFGIKTSGQETTWADMLAVWQAADDIDVYESGWTFDHFYPIFSDSSGPCLEGWTVTTALASGICAAAARIAAPPRLWPIRIAGAILVLRR